MRNKGSSLTPEEILEKTYTEAEKFDFKKLSNEQITWIKIIAGNCERQKAVVTALITSLVKKIETPSQDIRLHREEFNGGYSARVYDTKHITPFLKQKFPKIAMKESAWLTRSIEQPHPFYLNFPGKIKDKRVKEAFLRILHDIEENNANPQDYLHALFSLLKEKYAKMAEMHLVMDKIGAEITINEVINALKLHFFSEYKIAGAAKLPLIAVYSAYQLLLRNVERFKGKDLKPLRSLYSADERAGAIGDVEVLDESGKHFEAVEIKHGIPIDAGILRDAYKKFKDTPVKRYYLLTTAEPFIKEDEKEEIEKKINQIRREHGCEVIINGIIASLKYYLRLISPSEFLKIYTENLKKDKEVKEEHLKAWESILKSLNEKRKRLI